MIGAYNAYCTKCDVEFHAETDEELTEAMNQHFAKYKDHFIHAGLKQDRVF